MFAPIGYPIYPVAAGTVFAIKLDKDDNDFGGNRIYIQHEYASIPGKYWLSRYMHCDKISDLEIGKDVTTDLVIATVGDSGYTGPTPPHLHFEILLDPNDNGSKQPTENHFDWLIIERENK